MSKKARKIQNKDDSSESEENENDTESKDSEVKGAYFYSEE